MAAYLLTWNPSAWEWKDLEQCVKSVEANGSASDFWSVGVTKRILSNDRFYLMQLGASTRGLVGAGYFTSKPYLGEHWNKVKGAEALYCEIEFNQLVNATDDDYLVTHTELKGCFPNHNWTPMASGTSIPIEIADKLDEMLCQYLPSESPVYEEGAQRRVMSSRVERAPQARADCLAHYGLNCIICGFNFGEFYGNAGDGLIHVHHLEPLADSGATKTDPIRDLRPVCANCHAVIHRHQQPLSIEKMKDLIRRD